MTTLNDILDTPDAIKMNGAEPLLIQRPLTMAQIKKMVARHYEIEVLQLESKSREAHIVEPRDVAIYLAQEFTNNSTVAIGRAFGGRDHSTIMSACKRVSADLKKYDDAALSDGKDRKKAERTAATVQQFASLFERAGCPRFINVGQGYHKIASTVVGAVIIGEQADKLMGKEPTQYDA